MKPEEGGILAGLSADTFELVIDVGEDVFESSLGVVLLDAHPKHVEDVSEILDTWVLLLAFLFHAKLGCGPTVERCGSRRETWIIVDLEIRNRTMLQRDMSLLCEMLDVSNRSFRPGLPPIRIDRLYLWRDEDLLIRDVPPLPELEIPEVFPAPETFELSLQEGVEDSEYTQFCLLLSGYDPSRLDELAALVAAWEEIIDSTQARAYAAVGRDGGDETRVRFVHWRRGAIEYASGLAWYLDSANKKWKADGGMTLRALTVRPY